MGAELFAAGAAEDAVDQLEHIDGYIDGFESTVLSELLAKESAAGCEVVSPVDISFAMKLQERRRIGREVDVDCEAHVVKSGEEGRREGLTGQAGEEELNVAAFDATAVSKEGFGESRSCEAVSLALESERRTHPRLAQP